MTNILSELLQANGSFLQREVAHSKIKPDELKSAQDLLTEQAKENWDNAEWHREQAALVAESLDLGFQNDNVVNTYFPTITVGETEQVIIRERRGMKVFYTHRAGEIDESTITTDTWELPRDSLGWHVSEFEDDFRNNYGPLISELVPLGRMREQAEVNRRIFEMVRGAVPESSPYYVDATTTFDAAALNGAITEVQDVPPPSNVSIARPTTIVGRAGALNRIFDFPGWADEAQEELRLTGRLGRYRGANIVSLTNWTDENGAPYIPDDEIFVFGGHVGQFVLYGGARAKSWTENKVDFRHFRSRRDLGGAIWRPQAMRRIKIAAS